ncbi:MAG: TolC family protein [Candidatus Pedobacter colombiensis]|uniref:TolC family protein n=1 Tax=Candidatus Pedobacter colombiensis TaxID=3121371 RepID=A0AAJ6B4X7_9SPHI|nr:TolC family protein [Pedobacter sp.]WEK18152.1 MAG: TolC family protein [Pedobacter sp.]
MRLKLLLLCFMYIAIVHPVQSQGLPADTLKLTLNEAENQFLKNNLALMIQHYNIDNAKAQVITARLFQNPQLDLSSVLYNPVTKKILDLSQSDSIPSHNGEYTIGISQLFLTAGKRNKNIQLAKVGVEQATYQFFDLLRTLRYTLRNDFYSIYFQQQSEKVYNQEINALEKILVAFDEQYKRGYISEKEVLRIQSLLYSLKAEYTALQSSIESTNAEFKMLIKASPTSEVVALYNYDLYGQPVLTSVPYQKLLDSANLNRSDLKIAQANMAYNAVNLKVQQALAIPDITVSGNFDKLGSYIPNYTSIGLSFSLPFFNRNQGGIRQARVAIEQGKMQYQQQQNQVESDVASNYKIALKLELFCNSLSPKFKQDYTHLVQEVLKNYISRNIGLLDFLSYYDDFKNNSLLLNNALLNRVTSLEKLNYVTGTPFFNK